eukprot:6186710-Pleurochrysis_carterae.AAC.1
MIPDGGEVGALGTLSRSSAVAPSPTASVVCLNLNSFSFTHYNRTRGDRSTLGPSRGFVHTLGFCVPLA